jgi:hypothetical protein
MNSNCQIKKVNFCFKTRPKEGLVIGQSTSLVISENEPGDYLTSDFPLLAFVLNYKMFKNFKRKGKRF